jgi:ribosomal-protein-alanine N-acetyltransferase
VESKFRAENRDWLSPWEATIPLTSDDEAYKELPSFFEMVKILELRGTTWPLSFHLQSGNNTQLIGQITLGGVMYGAGRGGHIGYWIDRNFANRGYTTTSR